MISAQFFELVREWVCELFGPFDPRVQVCGVLPTDSKWPFTSYPLPYSQFRIAINLPSKDAEDWQIFRHLAHELVHCLTPNGVPTGQATALEEGLAEHSSIYLLERGFTVQGCEWKEQLSGPYLVAFNLVEEVVSYEGLEAMRAAVRKLRADTGLPFARLTPDHLSAHFQLTPRPLLEALSQPFAELR
jgi:hypothetical protein